jgi:hypothetical protein
MERRRFIFPSFMCHPNSIEGSRVQVKAPVTFAGAFSCYLGL